MSIGIRYRSSVRLLIAVAVLGAFLSFTDPQAVPLALLPVPFILVFYIFFIIFRWLVSRVTHATKHRNFIAVLLAILPALILLLSSLNQLSPTDIAVVGLLLFGGLFYLRYADFLS